MALIGVDGRQDVNTVMWTWPMRWVRDYAKAVDRLAAKKAEAAERNRRRI